MVEPRGALRRGWGRVLPLLVAGAVAGSVVANAGAALAAQAAAIVVDAKTGKVLYSSSPDARTYPASLTKMMTLYLLFEALDSGKTTLSSKIPIIAHAAAQAPSKLGLKPGQTITVRDAILAVVTKSANDIACAIGEYLAGSEGAFAVRMTNTAHAIGMSKTTFRNASGLPDSGQMTTARDMALLGRALRDRFPRYFPYFSTAELRLRRAAHPQSQPSARPRARRQRYQDRLHGRVRLQPRDLGRPRRSPGHRRRSRWQDRQGPRPEDGRAHQRICAPRPRPVRGRPRSSAPTSPPRRRFRRAGGGSAVAASSASPLPPARPKVSRPPSRIVTACRGDRSASPMRRGGRRWRRIPSLLPTPRPRRRWSPTAGRFSSAPRPT